MITEEQAAKLKFPVYVIETPEDQIEFDRICKAASGGYRRSAVCPNYPNYSKEIKHDT